MNSPNISHLSCCGNTITTLGRFGKRLLWNSTTFRVAECGDDQPRVATEGRGPSQPWADMWNPVGVRAGERITRISTNSHESEPQTFILLFSFTVYVESGSKLPPRRCAYSANLCWQVVFTHSSA